MPTSRLAAGVDLQFTEDARSDGEAKVLQVALSTAGAVSALRAIRVEVSLVEHLTATGGAPHRDRRLAHSSSRLAGAT